MGRDLTPARWLFFDVGSTLIDESLAREDRIRQLLVTLASMGRKVHYEEAIHLLEQVELEFAQPPFNTPFPAMLDRLLPDVADRDYVRCSARFRGELERPFPEARPVFKLLSQHYGIGVIANQSLGTEERLRRHGLMKYVSVCVASAEVGVSKPDPAIFRLALSEADCQPHEAVMIGDRIDNDMGPAKRVGMMTVRVLQGPHCRQEPRHGGEEPDYTVNGLGELSDLFGIK